MKFAFFMFQVSPKSSTTVRNLDSIAKNVFSTETSEYCIFLLKRR